MNGVGKSMIANGIDFDEVILSVGTSRIISWLGFDEAVV